MRAVATRYPDGITGWWVARGGGLKEASILYSPRIRAGVRVLLGGFFFPFNSPHGLPKAKGCQILRQLTLLMEHVLQRWKH